MRSNKVTMAMVCVVIIVLAITACARGKDFSKTTSGAGDNSPVAKTALPTQTVQPTIEPTTEPMVDTYKYNQPLHMLDDKYRTYYEVFLYSFCDSNGDGIGDIQGLISKLDYINDGDDTTDTDLGYTGIWLMPIMPSTTYHKYDVTDYYNIDPEYGTLEDFKQLIVECEKRGIHLIIDLVINHTSAKHPWFVEASNYLQALPEGTQPDPKECPYIEYYNFTYGEPGNGTYAKLGASNWYYECPFWDQMPDLNLDKQEVRNEIEKIVDFWMECGVSGFRLDAAKEYFSGRSSKNIEVLTWFNTYVKKKNPSAYIVAEVWEDISTYAQYYESGIDSVFNFYFSQNEGVIGKTIISSATDAKYFEEKMIRVQEELASYSQDAIDAPFFTNHDTARSAGFLAYNEERMKMAAGMNLMMSGCAYTYYGEEIGMTGSGKDENKRAPMYWNDSGEGMTVGPKEREIQENRFESVEQQQQDVTSLYSYYKRAVRLRNENPEIARGKMESVKGILNNEICAISKTYEGSTIYMLYNVSEEEIQVTLDKEMYPYDTIRGYLSATGEEVRLEGDTIILPRYSIVILK